MKPFLFICFSSLPFFLYPYFSLPHWTLLAKERRCGTPSYVGMRYSLQSRDLIADSIETVTCAQHHDANIAIPGCDKNMPGVIIAAARHNRPFIMIVSSEVRNYLVFSFSLSFSL